MNFSEVLFQDLSENIEVEYVQLSKPMSATVFPRENWSEYFTYDGAAVVAPYSDHNGYYAVEMNVGELAPDAEAEQTFRNATKAICDKVLEKIANRPAHIFVLVRRDVEVTSVQKPRADESGETDTWTLYSGIVSILFAI